MKPDKAINRISEDLSVGKRFNRSTFVAEIWEDRAQDIQTYRTIALDIKYAHFRNIPRRIIRCLDHFGIDYDSREVRERLDAYYLFIGVVDDAIDHTGLEIGGQVLSRLTARLPVFDKETQTSHVNLVTDVLRREIGEEATASVLTGFHELYEAVINERKAETIAVYVEQRKLVGQLTAEISYLIIEPFLRNKRTRFQRFLKNVGAVGCLIDSVIDLSSDRSAGLLSFPPTARNVITLVGETIRESLTLTVKHPALLIVFLAAVIDNVRDVSRRCDPPVIVPVSAIRKESAASVV
jgi:hypothetical protein